MRAVVAALILLVTMAYASSASRSDAPGLVLLGTVVTVNVMAVLVSAVAFFTPVLADERESGTLSLLKLCSDGDGSVLTGLVLPRLLTALVLLALQLPFALMAVTLGGVTSQQVFGCFLSLAASTLCLASVATMTASLTRTAGAATGYLITYAFLMYLAARVLENAFPNAPLHEWMASLDAILPWSEVSARLDDATRPLITPSFWSAIVQSVIALAVAAIAFKRSDVTAAATNDSFSTRVRVWAARHRNFAPRDFQRGPHAWKDYHLVAGGHVGIALKVIGYVGVAFVLTAIHVLLNSSWANSSWLNPFEQILITFGGTLAAIVACVLPIETAWLAAKRIRLEVDDRNWELLELLPTSNQFILSGKGNGTLRGLWASFAIAAFGLACMGAAAGPEGVFFAMAFGLGFGGVIALMVLICVWFTASHMALKYKAGTATGLTLLAMIGLVLLVIAPTGLFGGAGILISMLVIPVGLGMLVAAISSFPKRFFKRALLEE